MFVIRIRRDFCKSCALCIEVCPKNLLALDTELNRRGVNPAKVNGDPAKCTGCGNCATMCPDTAIEIEEVPEKK